MKISQSNTFKKAIKKLHRNQIPELKKAIEKIANNPLIGDMKRGDLAGVRVYKFHVHPQLVLLAYLYEEKGGLLKLIDVSSHENFYTALKRE
ncbi:MAG: type II toxin-antitoxin system RelE/ParE family toxin [Caedimonas sp.]|nr:type II toxin-antitoxin system RelE/ParE family toxin [Caedimonas sp.]